MEVYKYAFGTVRYEQDVVLAMDEFLVNEIGWTRVDTVTDTTSDRDYVWSSPGEDWWVEQGGDPLFIRMQAVSDYLYLKGYRTYENSSTYTFQIYHNADTHVDLNTGSMCYWFYGNKNFVCGIIMDPYIGSGNEPSSFYMGFVRSYYGFESDDFPMLIKGSRYQYYSWTDTEGCYMHNCTNSGQQWHENMYWWNYLQYDTGTLSRDCLVMLPVILVSRNSSNTEMRGEPYGVYQINGNRVANVGALATVSGVFLAMRHGSSYNNSNAFGPVASGVEDFDMWPSVSGGNHWNDGTKYVNPI